MSLNCQSASKSELERREEGRLVLVGPGSDANLRALIRVSAPPGTPEPRSTRYALPTGAAYTVIDLCCAGGASSNGAKRWWNGPVRSQPASPVHSWARMAEF